MTFSPPVTFIEQEDYDFDEDSKAPTCTHQIDETTRSVNVPTPPAWPQEWTNMVRQIRHAKRRVFWELFAGIAVMIAALAADGWATGPPIDIAENPVYNLLNPVFLAVVMLYLSHFDLVPSAKLYLDTW